jgi:SAM-dependent methyltransferase
MTPDDEGRRAGAQYREMPFVPTQSLLRAGAAMLLLLVGRGPAAAQAPAEPYTPQLNQPGKNVQWVPTPPALVEKMLDLAAVTAKDRVVDLGSGDGVLVIAAAKRGARARGIEYDARLVDYSKQQAAKAGVERLTSFVRGDIFKTRFEDATVVTTFLLPSMNLELRPRFLSMKPGTRIVANTFGIGDWQADEVVTIEPCERWCRGMLWYVPARVGGRWRTPKGDLVLTQRFQVVTGTLADQPIEDGKLRGEAITFRVAGTVYSGRVDGTRMRLSATVDGKPIEWTAIALAAR